MAGPASIPIWDPLVRVFHWTLATAVVVNYWFTESGGDVHTWVGYTAATAVAVRIAWGFLGTGHARFDDCRISVATVREHLAALRARRLPTESGHNPLGAMMIYLMLLLVVILATTGWLHEEIDALYGNSVLQTIHSYAAHTLWFCALLHVVAVFTIQHIGRIELVRPMINGRRRSS